MKLEIEEINYRLGYISVIDTDTEKTYFVQGEETDHDLNYIEKYGEARYLDYLAESGYFDKERN